MKKTAVEKPTVEVYEGREGLKTILEDVLKVKKEFLIIGNFGLFEEYFRAFAPMFVKKRVRAGIQCRLIQEKTTKNVQLQKTDKKQKRTTKFISGLEKLKSECYIYGDRITLITLIEEEPIGIIIKNKELSKLLTQIFEQLWTQEI